jgi:hypothetical protein
MPDRRRAGLLAAIAFLAYLPFFHGHFFGSDELTLHRTTRALFKNGNLAVPAAPHVYTGQDGRRYGHFGVAQPVLALPLFALGRLADAVLPEGARLALGGRPKRGASIDTLGGPEIFFVSLYAPLASAALVALFFLFQRRLGAPLRPALAASAVLGASTQVALMSVYFLQHTSEALAIVGAFYALVGFRQNGRVSRLAAASFLGSLTLLIRVPALVALPPLLGYGLFALAQRHGGRLRATPRELVALLAPALCVIAVHLALGRALWGTWLASPMLAQGRFFDLSRSHVGLLGFLLSPGASVFVYSPPLLMLAGYWRGFLARWRPEGLTALASALCLLFFCSPFEAWHGLWSAPGPRYLFAAVPLLLLPLGGWLATAGPRERACLAALAGFGALVQAVLMSARWSAVIRLMDYERFAPDMRFLFRLDETPLEGSLRALAAGEIDAWLWGLWHGWDGAPGHPVAAAVLVALWGAALALALRALRRGLDAPAEPAQAPRAGAR